MKKLYFHISSQNEIMHENVSEIAYTNWNSILYLHVHTKTSTIEQHGTRSLKMKISLTKININATDIKCSPL